MLPAEMTETAQNLIVEIGRDIEFLTPEDVGRLKLMWIEAAGRRKARVPKKADVIGRELGLTVDDARVIASGARLPMHLSHGPSYGAQLSQE